MTAHAGGRVVTGPELVVVADPDAVAGVAARRIASSLAEAVGARGRADWATTGGSSAPPIYRLLAGAPLRDAVPWPAVHVWWGDDRYVPRDHPLSNVKPLDDNLRVPLPIENVHPFPTTAATGEARGAAWCAQTLAGELSTAGLEVRDGMPVLDLVLLGVGADGHVLSVFPGSPALTSGELAMAIPAPTHIEPYVERVTLNPAILRVARGVLVVVSGEDKAAVLGDVFGPERDPARWPAQLAVRDGATWIVDAAAAARIDR